MLIFNWLYVDEIVRRLIQCFNSKRVTGGLFIVMNGILLIISACKQDSDKLEQAFNQADDNKEELQKVLDYYSQKPQDSLKLRASIFLIENMIGHFGYEGEEIDQYSVIFKLIDSLSHNDQKVTLDQKEYIIDSVTNVLGIMQSEKAQKVADLETINTKFLIDNIESAFHAWENAPWFKEVPFDDFCAYILPYRIKHERLEYWRSFYYNQYKDHITYSSDITTAYEHFDWLLNQGFDLSLAFENYLPYDLSMKDIEKGKIGSCTNISFFVVNGMRAVGLPVAYDYIMHWGSVNNRHYMPALVSRSNKRDLITNGNIKKDTWKLVNFSSEFVSYRHNFVPSELPEDVYIQYNKTIPKVYRYMYSRSDLLDSINKNVSDRYIAPEFKNVHLMDVTSEYLTVADVDVRVDPRAENHGVGYLCVFDIAGWQPVAISGISDGHLTFKDVGKNVVFLPTVYEDGVHIPIGPPFFVDSTGTVKKIIADRKKSRRVNLTRKYPLLAYTAYHTEILKNGRFEGANNPDFSDATTLYKINNYPFFVNFVKSGSNRKVRYVRYVAPADADFEADNIAEVTFYGEHRKRLQGKLIGMEGTDGHEIEKAFDQNLASFYENKNTRNGWIGMDLGQGNEQEIKGISFCPRNDTNNIIPDNIYELFYWGDGRWISLGRQTATDYSLRYEHVPKNALFWLRCLSSGREERIFTYGDCGQIWW